MLQPKLILLFILCFVFLSANAQLTYHEVSVQYDSAWTYKNLKLIPVKFVDSAHGKPAPGNSAISFEEAFRNDQIKVREINTPMGSDIGVLEIINEAKKDILIHSGDIITGGKQNRTAAQTILIPAGKGKNYLQVFCVEKERWDNKSKPFTYGGMADANLRREIDVQQKQNKVWKEIDSQFQKRNIQSQTWNYANLYKDSAGIDSEYLHFFKNKMARSDSSFAGFIAVSGTRIINCELFGSSQLCLLSYLNLVKSYVKSIPRKIDVPAVSDEEVQNFADNFLQSQTEQDQYAGEHGRIYKAGNFIIHLVVYGE